MSFFKGAFILISSVTAITVIIYVTISFCFDKTETYKTMNEFKWRFAISWKLPDATPKRTEKNMPRVMCMIFTTPGNFERRGRAVEKTWSRHCYRRRFFYSRPENSLTNPMTNLSEAVGLDVPEGRAHLTAKTMAALMYSYRNYANDTDWFMKADDDVYVIFNNLLSHLCKYDPSTPTYVGNAIFAGTMAHLPKGYNSGGAGYLLSNRASEKVVNVGITKFPSSCKIKNVGGSEDLDMGACLQSLNIFPEDTRDSLKQLTFHSQNPMRLIRGVLQESSDHVLEQYFSMLYNGVDFSNFNDTKKTRILGRESISFHYVSAAEMYFIDYLVSLAKMKMDNNATFCQK